MEIQDLKRRSAVESDKIRNRIDVLCADENLLRGKLRRIEEANEALKTNHKLATLAYEAELGQFNKAQADHWRRVSEAPRRIVEVRKVRSRKSQNLAAARDKVRWRRETLAAARGLSVMTVDSEPEPPHIQALVDELAAMTLEIEELETVGTKAFDRQRPIPPQAPTLAGTQPVKDALSDLSAQQNVCRQLVRREERRVEYLQYAEMHKVPHLENLYDVSQFEESVYDRFLDRLIRKCNIHHHLSQLLKGVWTWSPCCGSKMFWPNTYRCPDEDCGHKLEWSTRGASWGDPTCYDINASEPFGTLVTDSQYSWMTSDDDSDA